MEKQKIAFILVGISILAFVLRWYLMPSHLFFGPEQGRDFLVIRDIVVNHKLTLIGSKTDIDGVFHGPVYYYLAAIPFFFSSGDPMMVFGFFTAIQSVTVFIVYLFVVELTKQKRAGLIAATLFAVSYLCIVYSRWLSNPPLSIPLSVLFMLFLWRFVRGKPWYLVAAAFVYGLLGQTEFINYLLFACIGGVACLIYWKQISKVRVHIMISALIVGCITSFATYILFDLRHNFLVMQSVKGLLSGKSGMRLDIVTSAFGAFRVFFEQASQTIGLWGWFAGAILICVLLFLIRERIVFVWLFVPPILFALLRHAMLDQLYAGVVAGFLIALAIGIDRSWQNKRIVGISIFGAIIIANIMTVSKNLQDNYHVFFQPQQPSVRYTDQLAIVDWVYKEAAGRPFEIQAYTIPYFLQQAWTYIFDWRGQQKYGYVPTAVDRKLLYVIIQKDHLDPVFQKNWYDTTVSTWGVKKKEFVVGEYTVEERMPL